MPPRLRRLSGSWQAGSSAVLNRRGMLTALVAAAPGSRAADSFVGAAQGLINNGLFGRSTNQELLNGSRNIHLQTDDWVFLRPTQSEFVFLQFGDIAVYDGGAIIERWPVFSEEPV